MEMRDEFHAALNATYAIERELGGGGMSRVFVAEERALGRQVVVKVLPAEIADELSVERFTREIQVAARLQHPHIVPLLNAGEANGILYYTMPLIQGETLRSRLARHDRITPANAVEIAIDVADALSYAHDQGVMHRDIKPENILLSAGYAVIVDFGIARALDLSRTSVTPALTQTGVFLGTPMYMSPEQAAGEREIDARTDIYSLGAVLYEMLAGRPPFAGATAAAVIAKRFVEKPPPLRAIDGDIPVWLERTVDRAMAFAPEHRFAGAAELLDALRGGDQTAGARPDHSIAVLPFVNMSADPDSEYFSDGITEDIINALVHVPGLRVAARTSSFAFKGTRADVGEIGAKLRVSTVLEGSVRRAGSRLRITAQLISVADGYHLWSERYDREMEDVFAIQDEIARAIAKELELTLWASAEKPLVARGTQSLDAYDLYLKGRYFWERRGQNLKKAREYFERAVTADPAFALAQAGMADCHCLLALYGYVSSTEAFEPARVAVTHALTFDERSAEAHAASGLFELTMGWNFDRGERELRRAAELNPASAMSWSWLGNLLPLLGRPADAEACARRSMQLEPLSPLVNLLAGMTFVYTRAWADAVDAVQRAIELEPLFPPGLAVAGMLKQRERRFSAAIAELEQAAELSGRAPFIVAFLGGAFANAGAQDEARAILHELESANADPWFRAIVYWQLGDDTAAFELIERALQARNANMVVHARHIGLEGLIADPRWPLLLRRAGIPDPVSPSYASLRPVPARV